jgi:hypothetical protein
MRFLTFALALGAMPAGAASNIERFQSHDFVFPATAPGNPFDVEIVGEFSGPDGAHLRVPSLYEN